MYIYIYISVVANIYSLAPWPLLYLTTKYFPSGQRNEDSREAYRSYVKIRYELPSTNVFTSICACAMIDFIQNV